MGIDTLVKQHFVQRYPDAWCVNDSAVKTLEDFLARDDTPYQPGGGGGAPRSLAYPPILCLDHTAKIKYLRPGISTGDQYVRECVFSDMVSHFNAAGGNAGKPRVVYMCFDRGAPENKAREHLMRYSKVELMPVPEYDGVALISDVAIPSEEHWKGFVSNKQLVGDLIHYITSRLLDEHPTRAEATFTPPPGCHVVLHGGRSMAPNRQRVPVPMPEPAVYFVENAYDVTTSALGLEQLKTIRRRGVHDKYPAAEVDNLREGELAALYFARHHPMEDVHFISPDGDMLLQLLLLAPDRIDPATGQFRNRHYLQLSMQGGSDFVDINQLYADILADPALSALCDPVLTLVALGALPKNDYVKDYCPGIKTIGGADSLAVFKVLYEQAADFRAMFTLLPRVRGNPNSPCIIDVDEKQFVAFTHAVYVAKYTETVAKKLKCSPSSVVLSDVQKHLAGFKDDSRHVMPTSSILVIARQLLWVLEYWHNGYRNQCIVYPPHALYQNLPFYGWEVEASGHCMPATVVSPAMPRRTETLAHMYWRQWDELVANIELAETDNIEEAERLKTRREHLKALMLPQFMKPAVRHLTPAPLNDGGGGGGGIKRIRDEMLEVGQAKKKARLSAPSFRVK